MSSLIKTRANLSQSEKEKTLTLLKLRSQWYRHQGLPPTENPTNLCTTQAVLIQVGDTASAFSSLIITLNLFSVIVFSRHPSFKALGCIIVLQWVIVGILAAIGPRWLQHEGMPFCELFSIPVSSPLVRLTDSVIVPLE